MRRGKTIALCLADIFKNKPVSTRIFHPGRVYPRKNLEADEMRETRKRRENFDCRRACVNLTIVCFPLSGRGEGREVAQGRSAARKVESRRWSDSCRPCDNRNSHAAFASPILRLLLSFNREIAKELARRGTVMRMPPQSESTEY